MEFKDVLAQLGRIISPLHKSQSCRLEQRAILQYSVLLEAAKDAAFLGGLLQRWLEKQVCSGISSACAYRVDLQWVKMYQC